jgi:hypothetical protein
LTSFVYFSKYLKTAWIRPRTETEGVIKFMIVGYNIKPLVFDAGAFFVDIGSYEGNTFDKRDAGLLRIH